MPYRHPPGDRVGLALIAGAVSAALPVVILTGGLALIALPAALVVTFGHALLFALPAYLALRSRVPLTFASGTVAGMIVGVVPFMILIMVTAGNEFANDWRGLASAVGTCAGLGAIGGFVFRLVIGPPVEEFAVDPAVFE
jgi:hypothetical protein